MGCVRITTVFCFRPKSSESLCSVCRPPQACHTLIILRYFFFFNSMKVSVMSNFVKHSFLLRSCCCFALSPATQAIALEAGTSLSQFQCTWPCCVTMHYTGSRPLLRLLLPRCPSGMLVHKSCSSTSWSGLCVGKKNHLTRRVHEFLRHHTLEELEEAWSYSLNVW